MEKELYAYNIYWMSPKGRLFLVGYLYYETDLWVYSYSEYLEDARLEGFHPFIELYDTTKTYNDPLMFKSFLHKISLTGEPIKHITDNIFIRRQEQRSHGISKIRHNKFKKSE